MGQDEDAQPLVRRTDFCRAEQARRRRVAQSPKLSQDGLKAEALALGITNWSTPKATDGAKGGPGQSYGSGGTPPLPAQAAQWQTPVADDQMDRLRGKINSRGEPKLSAQALQWPTPAAQNWKGSSEASITRADGKSRMDINGDHNIPSVVQSSDAEGAVERKLMLRQIEPAFLDAMFNVDDV